MLRIFIGYDPRQPISYQVLHYSILKYATVPVSITPLVIETLPIKRVGLTPFTYSRFLVPYLCDYQGSALFLDADMLFLDDVKKLFDRHLLIKNADVSVVMNQKRFEWASLMLFNNERCKILTPEFIEKAERLHGLEWAENVGALTSEWNVLAGYDTCETEPKLIHYTQGVPCFPETNLVEYNEKWLAMHKEMNSARPWSEIMGGSVHSVNVNGRPIPKYLLETEISPMVPKERFDSKVRELLCPPSVK